MAPRATRTRYNQRRKAAIAAGTWIPRQPVGPVRQHLRDLHGRGATYRRIADETGIGVAAINRILNDDRQQYVYGATAAAILAYTPAPQGNPATTVTRQLQALAVIGVPTPLVAKWTGSIVTEDHLDRLKRARYSRVSLAVAAAVGAAYRRGEADLLANAPHPMVAGGNQRVRTRALAKGWHGPLAWDDDTIGDPDASPTDDVPVARRRSRDRDALRVWLALDGVVPAEDLTLAERHEVLAVLVGRGWTDQEIGDHLSWGDTPDRRHDNAQQYRRRAGLVQPPAVVGHRVELRAYAAA